jgi:proliferating cell nuclear antigen
MYFKTIQASAFKACFEVLKDILNDVNIYFTPEGITITTLDTARAALVDLKLSSENFENYLCSTPEHIAGINISNTFKLLKPITNNDTLTVELKDREFLNFKIENEGKRSNTEFKLKLLDIDEDQIEIPKIDAEVTSLLPSIDFQRICRDMTNLASEIRISRDKNKLIFSCEGDFANQTTEIECIDNEEFNDKLSGLYSLKYLNLFTKATGMCATVQIMMEKDMKFLMLKYNVANLGELKFYLATKVEDEE